MDQKKKEFDLTIDILIFDTPRIFKNLHIIKKIICGNNSFIYIIIKKVIILVN
jgi:hypothetical protein